MTKTRLAFLSGALSIVTLGSSLRLYRLGAQELWVDETFSFFVATLPDWLRYLSIDSTPPLYYVMLRAWAGVLGTDEFALRLLSATVGTLTVAAAIWIGSRMLSPLAGLCSGLFVAVAPHHVYYSQEARAYALLVLLLFLTHAAYWRAFERPRKQAWVTATVCAAAALYTHYLTLFALVPTALLPLLWRERSRLKHYAASVVVACGLVAPWMVWNLIAKSRVLDGGSPIGWIRAGWLKTPPALAVFKSLEVLGVGSRAGFLPFKLKQFDTLDFPGPLRAVGVAGLLALTAVILVPWGDAGMRVDRIRDKKRYLLAAMLVPLLTLWAISFVRPLYVAGRSDLIVFPAYALLVGLAFTKLAARGRVGIAAAVVLGLCLIVPDVAKLSRYYEAEATTLRRETAAAVAAVARDGDVVVMTGLRGPGLLYYLAQSGIRWRDGVCVDETTHRRFGCRFFPTEIEAVLTARIVDPAADGGAIARRDVERYLEGFDFEGATVWIVFDRLQELENVLSPELARRGLEPVTANRRLHIAGYAPRGRTSASRDERKVGD